MLTQIAIVVLEDGLCAFEYNDDGHNYPETYDQYCYRMEYIEGKHPSHYPLPVVPSRRMQTCQRPPWLCNLLEWFPWPITT